MLKNARRCGEKHIHKSKCTKHLMLGALFEVRMRIMKSKCPKNWGPGSTFWSSDVQKNARCCGEKRIRTSKCLNYRMLGALFEVLMSKTCTPLWRKAHYEVRMLKNWGFREHFLKVWCWKNARRCGEKHIHKSKCAKHLMLGALFEVQVSKN